MKVYLFFANRIDVIEGILNFKFFPSVTTTHVYDREYLLYAFTTNKKYKDSFFQLRKKEYFYMKEEYMEKDEFLKFRSANITLELSPHIFSNYVKENYLITADYEFDESRHLWIDLFSQHTSDIFGFLPYMITEAFKDKYRDAVCKLGLNAALVVIDEELSSIMENMAYEFDDDYVLTMPRDVHKDLLGRKVTVPVSIAGKTLNSFIHIFKEILNK